MNLIELQRALRQLRLGGTAAVLETRLRQAQAEAMAPIDPISCLVSDELTRRSERLLDRRRKQAAFRDPHKMLDNFDFTFNPKMNRSLVFDLATCTFIGKREDALFVGPGGTGKSHLAQAIGQAGGGAHPPTLAGCEDSVAGRRGLLPGEVDGLVRAQSRRRWRKRRSNTRKPNRPPACSPNFSVRPSTPGAAHGGRLPRRSTWTKEPIPVSCIEKGYCARGECPENRIKEQQLDLFADRTSTGKMWSNQLRLYFSSIAYVLLQTLRRTALACTELEKAQCGTIRR
jgi:hypothetical protein